MRGRTERGREDGREGKEGRKEKREGGNNAGMGERGTLEESKEISK